MLSRIRVVASRANANLVVRHTTTATDTQAPPTLTPTPMRTSTKLQELNELSLALTQRGHTCVNTTASPSVMTWCGNDAGGCSGPGKWKRASIQFPDGQPRRVDDLSKVFLAFAVAPWAGILIGSVIFR